MDRSPLGAPEAARLSQAGLLSAAPPYSGRDALIRAEQIKSLYRTLPRMWGAPFSALLTVIAMYREIPAGTLAAWYAVLCATIAWNLLLYFRYRRAAPPPEEAGVWAARFIVVTVAYGAAWGSAGVVMFRPELTGYQMFLVLGLFMMVLSVVAGGVSAYMPVAYAFMIPAIGPLIVRSAAEGDFAHWLIAGAGIVLTVLTLYYATHLNALILESFNLRFENLERLRENERLVEALERERHEVLAARDRAEEASHAKSRFLAAASHDLRQPLHTLSLYSAALKLHAPAGATGEIAGHIGTALGSLSALVDSLLDISKLDAGAVQPELQCVSMRALVERIEADYRPVANRKGLEFHVDAADAFVETDPVLLERLVRNLVDNAFKYTATGSITLASESGERTARIVVRDTGPGIPASERERIFEEFYQIGNPERDRSQGLGLGLAIVRRLAHLLELEVELQSELGRGSSFTVTLARAPEGRAEARTPAALPAADSSALDGARVLVIDDEPEVRAGMRALLERLGCRVAACGSCAEAERLLDEEAVAIDLIVADFRLRRHENGIDTVRRLRARLGEVPALLVSGDTAPERLREAQSSGLPLLHKPVSVDTLTEAMLAALRR